jgi:gephyrin
MRRVAVVIVSDRCASGEAEDKTGPAIRSFLEQHPAIFQTRPSSAHSHSHTDSPRSKSGNEPVPTTLAGTPHGTPLGASLVPSIAVRIVPDDVQAIRAAVTKYADEQKVHIIITSGGTGFSQRDNTPEAVGPLLHREAPGIVHAMLSYSLKQTPYAWLSRPVAGIRGRTIIICVPGSPTAAVECLTPLVDSGLDHAVELVSGNQRDSHPGELTLLIDPNEDSINRPVRSPAADATRLELPHESRPSVANRSRQSTFEMVSMTAALDAIARNCPKPTPIGRTLGGVGTRVLGHVLAENIVSRFPHPPFRASVKDGYAVRSSEVPGSFPVQGALLAGANPSSCLQSGHIIRVNTGGPIPDGADAVVQVEDTTLEAADGPHEVRVHINVRATPGQDIRSVGCDLAQGAVAVSAGSVIGPPEIALAHAVGVFQIAVYRRPVVAVLSTGNELADLQSQGGPIPPAGQIFDSNRSMLLAALEELGYAVVDLGIAKDEYHDTMTKLQRAIGKADVVLSSGGVSMGEVDMVKDCLLDLHATIHFGRVNMKPGKPTTFATKDRMAFFGLPGNPVSAMVCFHLFVLPYLRQFEGKSPAPTVIRAVTAESVKLDRERPEYHRCRLTFDSAKGYFVASSTGIQASHRLQSMAGANGLMVLPTAPSAEQVLLPAGSGVEVIVIGRL